MTFAALLDTSVLWPSTQRDFLLSLAVEGLYRPLWSEAILDELEMHEAQKLHRRHGLPQPESTARARGLRAAMSSAFDDAVVLGWEPLEGTYGLPDPDDEHVLAAAVLGGAGALVTSNLKDFPHDLVPAGMHVIPPQEFATNTVAIDPVRSLLACDELVRRSGRHAPAYDREALLDILEGRYRMTAAVELLREAAAG